MSTMFLTDRPKSHSPAIREAALRKLLPEVLEWLEQGGEKDADQDDVLKQLSDAAGGFADDGYRIAYQLERHHYWSPDSNLVSVLDSFAHYLWSARDEAVRNWASENAAHLTPVFAIGDKVSAKWGGKTITGSVEGIDAKLAQYIIRRDYDGKGGGAVVAFEDTEATK